MAKRKEYRDRWCGMFRCFCCGLYNNGNVFHWWTTVVQVIMVVLTVACPILPWLQVFDFLDANANNRLEFHEIATAAKDKNFIFFGQHIRTDSEMMQSLLAYQSSPCIQSVLTSLQDSCGVGDRGACLQPQRWVAENGIFMKNPQKIQKCIFDLIQPSYVVSTGDDCTSNQVREWLTSGVESAGSKCLMQTSINIQEFGMYARHLVPGLPSDEVLYPNHCINTTIDFYFSIYGAMTVFMSLTNAEDAAKARCHTYTGRVDPKNFSCSLILDFWTKRGYDVAPPGAGLDPFSPPVVNPINCRDMTGWMIDVLDGQLNDFGCSIKCTPMGRAVLGPGCVKSNGAMVRENRYVNSPFHPTCALRNGTGAVGDDCKFEQTCPSCSYPVNSSSVLYDKSPIKSAHSGTSGFSANYDTLCGLKQMKFVGELMASVREERIIKAIALQEKTALANVLSGQCTEKRNAGDFANGELQLGVSTTTMKNWPKGQAGLQGSGNRFSCKCPVNQLCQDCVKDCMDYGFTYPKASPSFDSTFDCNETSQDVVSTEGSAAFNPQDKFNMSLPQQVWMCEGDKCSKAEGLLNPSYKWAGTVRQYGAPQPILAVMEVFGALCTVSMGVLGLFVGALCMQLYNLHLVWSSVKSSDDMSVEDAWDEEKFVLRSCVITCIIALVPAILYGSYISILGHFDLWGATHALSYGWYIAILLSAVSLVPFYGAYLSYISRPASWRNAMSTFQNFNASDKGWRRFFRRQRDQKDPFKTSSVVPVGDEEKGEASTVWEIPQQIPRQKSMGYGSRR